jgi:hypothetical protein
VIDGVLLLQAAARVQEVIAGADDRLRLEDEVLGRAGNGMGLLDMQRGVQIVGGLSDRRPKLFDGPFFWRAAADAEIDLDRQGQIRLQNLGPARAVLRDDPDGAATEADVLDFDHDISTCAGRAEYQRRGYESQFCQ